MERASASTCRPWRDGQTDLEKTCERLAPAAPLAKFGMLVASLTKKVMYR